MTDQQSPLRLLHNLIEHFLGEPAPPPLSAEQLTVIVREAARVAAREAAREVIAELLGKVRTPLAPVPAAWAEVAEPADIEPLTVVPDLAPEAPAATLEGQLAESVERARAVKPSVVRQRAATAEKEAAAELFVSEVVTRDGAGPRDYVSFPDLAAAYEKWRPHIDAPEVAPRFLGGAMTRAGFTRRQAHSGIDQRFRTGSKPMLYLGVRLRVVEAPAPEPPQEPEQPPAWMASESENKRDDLANGYIGQWPGREVPNDFRNKIIVPVLRSGKGWVYKKANGNGAGKPRLISPEGRVFTLPNTPSDWRALRNTAGSLRKLGLEGVV